MEKTGGTQTLNAAHQVHNGLNGTNTNAEVNRGTITADKELVDYIAANADLDLASREVEFISRAIENDLQTVEVEAGNAESPLTEISIGELKEYCCNIESKVTGDLRRATERFVRLDTEKRTGAADDMTTKMNGFMDRLRAVRTEIRKARVADTPLESLGGDSAAVTSGDSSRGYRPFVERLKPPTFFGKVKEWPDFVM